MKLNTPLKNFSLDDITQGFNKDHPALDIVENSQARSILYGTPLCAMEDCLVTEIVRGDKLTEDNEGIKRGYGLRLLGEETGFKYLYWHCLPFFPVSENQIVKRGQIIAYMGNAGTVYSGGVYVPIVNRLDKEKKGTHLHLQVYNTKGKLVDPLPLIDFALQPTYTEGDKVKAFAVVVGKMALSLKRK